MNSSKASMSVLMIALLLVLAPAAESAITCSDVLKTLRPCVNYLVSGSGLPPAACCSAVSGLASSTAAPADKKAACACIKAATKSLNPNAQLAKDLPKNCGISLAFPVTPNVDCSKIA